MKNRSIIDLDFEAKLKKNIPQPNVSFQLQLSCYFYAQNFASITPWWPPPWVNAKINTYKLISNRIIGIKASNNE